MKIGNLESLKNIAFCIPDGKSIRITWSPGATAIYTVSPGNLTENTYCDMHDVIAFYHDKALYVIPSMQNIPEILKDNGFIWKPMNVLFALGNYPTWHKRKWKRLLKMAKEENCRV